MECETILWRLQPQQNGKWVQSSHSHHCIHTKPHKTTKPPEKSPKITRLNPENCRDTAEHLDKVPLDKSLHQVDPVADLLAIGSLVDTRLDLGNLGNLGTGGQLVAPAVPAVPVAPVAFQGWLQPSSHPVEPLAAWQRC